MYELTLQFINSLCFTYFPASGHLNGDICLWNAETSKLITKLISHRSGMNCLNFILPIVLDTNTLLNIYYLAL